MKAMERFSNLSVPICTLFLCSIISGLCGCISTFSELQGARLLGTGKYEATVGYSSVRWSENSEDTYSDDRFGVLLGAGLLDNIDLRMRYERVSFGNDEGFNVLGFGPKVSIIPGKLALYTPVGFAFGSGLEVGDTFEFHPTAIFTIAASRMVDINTSGKILFRKIDEDDMVAFNVGLAVSPESRRITFRPEIGTLFNPGESGHFWHFSIAFSSIFGH